VNTALATISSTTDRGSGSQLHPLPVDARSNSWHGCGMECLRGWATMMERESNATERFLWLCCQTWRDERDPKRGSANVGLDQPKPPLSLKAIWNAFVWTKLEAIKPERKGTSPKLEIAQNPRRKKAVDVPRPYAIGFTFAIFCIFLLREPMPGNVVVEIMLLEMDQQVDTCRIIMPVKK
jgi:hypothetical protein